ncbi:hypothetical protein L6452_18911 [Arctium lappa]|uniref:Uncharacterized protein n=1 Tax=Arctium lappa TaxID=4217 RepID=A0ACB9B803_ARCLA|nr:hypothetical protein L6452_18911 [Arctium lappa]
MTEDKGSAIALPENSKEDHPSIISPITTETTITNLAISPTATPIITLVNTPLPTPIATPIIPTSNPLVSPAIIPHETLSKLLGIEMTPVPTNLEHHQTMEQKSPIQHQLMDEPSEKTMEPTPASSEHTQPLGTPVANSPLIEVVTSHVDMAPPQSSPRDIEHTPSVSPISPMHTATTPSQKKRLTANKKKKQVVEKEIAEDTEVEEISPPKRITRLGAQTMAQYKGSSKATLQHSPSIAEANRDGVGWKKLYEVLDEYNEDRIKELYTEVVVTTKANLKPPNVIEGEVHKATAKLKKSLRKKTDKLKGRISRL